MKIQIKNRFNGSIIFEHERENNSVKITVELAVSLKISLDGANLACANLAGANLADATLVCANLNRANLAYANLVCANLNRANLADATLVCANLNRANLAYANLADATLADATLVCANLVCANLAGANLNRANLAGANLADATLVCANLVCANLAGATGNGREVMSFVCVLYRGVFTADFMWIGCSKHPVKTWWKDSDKEKASFTPNQLEWRSKNRKWIQAMVKDNPAVPTRKSDDK